MARNATPPRYILSVAEPRLNPDVFIDRSGVLHPIRGSNGYNERLVRQREHQRELTGLTSADQQLGTQFDQAVERDRKREKVEARLGPIEQRLYELDQERDGLREKIQQDPAARYTALISEHGRARSEAGFIPWETFRRYVDRPERYRTAAVVRNGKRYVRWEYALDDKADELGYRDSVDFRDAIQQAIKDKRTLAKLDQQIGDAKDDLRKAKDARTNPEPDSLDGILDAIGNFFRRLGLS